MNFAWPLLKLVYFTLPTILHLHAQNFWYSKTCHQKPPLLQETISWLLSEGEGGTSEGDLELFWFFGGKGDTSAGDLEPSWFFSRGGHHPEILSLRDFFSGRGGGVVSTTCWWYKHRCRWDSCVKKWSHNKGGLWIEVYIRDHLVLIILISENYGCIELW